MELNVCFLSLFPVLAALGYEHVPWWGNGLLALWLWALGGNLGSFMNVVVYRVPLGRSVVHPGSRCPNCNNDIAWYDNIPVISWTLLRARCRYCKITISSRYPCVEALVAAVVLVLGFMSPVALGRNLPDPLLRVPLQYETAWLWLLFAFHVLLLCTLICAALIRYDRQPTPLRLFIPAAIVGCFATLLPPVGLWSALRPVSFFAFVDHPAQTIAIWDSVSGIVVGAALGLFAAVFAIGDRRRALEFAEVPAVALAGLFLGWQAACAVMCYASAAHLATRLMTRGATRAARIPLTAHLVLGIIVFIILWRPIVESAPWLGNHASLATFGLAGCLVAILSYLTSLLQVESPGPSFVDSHGPALSDRLAEMDSALQHDERLPQRDELQMLRMQLEILEPEIAFTDQGLDSTVLVLGAAGLVSLEVAGAAKLAAQARLAEAPGDVLRQQDVERAERICKNAGYYEIARQFSRLVSATPSTDGSGNYVITTGDGSGTMEAANLGARDVDAKTIQVWLGPPIEDICRASLPSDRSFPIAAFELRKQQLLSNAKAIVVFPGGRGTLDELFDALAVRQKQRMPPIPIVIIGKAFWDAGGIDLQSLADESPVAELDLELLSMAETAEEAWERIQHFHHDAVDG